MTLLQYLLPQHILSRLGAKVANCRIRLIKNLVIYLCCRFYRITMTDALETNPFNYSTFNDFFTRALQPAARPIAGGEQTVVAPVDGRVWQIGKLNANYFVSAKGHNFTVEQLLAARDLATQFNDADFTVLYLAPSDYHRIHMPIKGKLASMHYVPGKLFSVKPSVINNIPGVFAKNERVIINFETAVGNMAMILVGAMFVGSIVTTWAGTIVPSYQETVTNWDYTKQDLVFAKGEEVGRFKFGSTVILLYPAGTIQWHQELQQNTVIKMGQSLGCGKNAK